MALSVWMLIAVTFNAGARADDWPRFHGPNGSGVSSSTGIPAEFGPSRNLLWQAAAPFSRSSPVVAGGRVYLTGSEGGKRITVCFDASSGRQLWRNEVLASHPASIYKGNDAASPTPTTDGQNVYVFFPDLGVISYDNKGRERWRVPLGPFDSFYGLAASPVLSGGTLLMLCDARIKPFLVALDAATGKVRWRVERTEVRFEGYATPLVHQPAGQPAQLLVLGANRVDAFSVATGERLWFFKGLGYFPVASPIIVNDSLIVNTFGSDAPSGPSFDDFLKYDADKDGRLSREELRSDPEMYGQFGAFDVNRDGLLDRDEWESLRLGGVGLYGMVAIRIGGRGDVTRSATLWRNTKTYSTLPSSLVYNNVLYLVKGGGILASLDPANGKEFKVGRTREAMEEHWSSPVAAGGKVIFVSESGKITVVKAGREWEVIAVNDLAEETYATPAIAGGRLFVRTKSKLYCFGAKR